jgi:hypothetical protein
MRVHHGLDITDEGMFERKITLSDGQRRRQVLPSEVRLSLDDVDRYVVAAARARGYPEEFLTEAARQVRFLEARGLPGFASFRREMLEHGTETLTQRGQVARPDGQSGGQCPMIDALRIAQRFDRIVALPPGRETDCPMPSNPLLAVPMLAECAGLHGVIMMTTFYIHERPGAYVFVDGDRAALHGSYHALFEADSWGIARFPEETHGTPPLREAHVETIEFPADALRDLMTLIESQP